MNIRVENKVKVLLVASFGGHFKQLMRVKALLDDPKYDFTIVSTNKGLNVHGYIPDLSADGLLKIVFCFPVCLFLLIKHKPKYVVSTGALPGLCMIVVAKLLRKKTVWVDSIANYSQPSKSGIFAKRWSDLWCTQWPHLSHEIEGLTYIGRIL